MAMRCRQRPAHSGELPPLREDWVDCPDRAEQAAWDLEREMGPVPEIPTHHRLKRMHPARNPLGNPGNSAGNSPAGPAAPSGDANLPVKTTALDGTETLTIPNPDGSKEVVITDPFGNQTFKAGSGRRLHVNDSGEAKRKRHDKLWLSG